MTVFQKHTITEIIQPTLDSIAIIGVGNVGGTLAFALNSPEFRSEITLYDTDITLLNSQITDLRQSQQPNSKFVTYHSNSSLSLIKKQSLLCICSGKKQAHGQSRTDLFNENYSTIKNLLLELIPNNPNTYILILTNPVDSIINKLFGDPDLQKHSESFGYIISTGTLLDTHRLYDELDITPDYDYTTLPMILGEHGDSQSLYNPTKRIISAQTLNIIKHSAQTIIKGKGYTNFAITNTALFLIRRLFSNESSIIPITSYLSYESDNFRTSLSLPILIKNGQLISIAKGFDTPSMTKSLQKSIAVITQTALQ